MVFKVCYGCKLRSNHDEEDDAIAQTSSTGHQQHSLDGSKSTSSSVVEDSSESNSSSVADNKNSWSTSPALIEESSSDLLETLQVGDWIRRFSHEPVC